MALEPDITRASVASNVTKAGGCMIIIVLSASASSSFVELSIYHNAVVLAAVVAMFCSIQGLSVSSFLLFTYLPSQDRRETENPKTFFGQP
jgi:hypothetical protein